MFFKRLANLVSGTLAIFLFLWGFNYVDKGFAERSALPESNELIDLSRHYISIMDTAMFYRSEIAGIDKLSSIVDLENLPTDSAINFWVKNVLENYNYPTNPEIPVRRIKPTGTLRRLSIAGIYNPFTGEANVDNALPSLPLIFTTAHEIAHGYGVTSEAEANFVAYLACMQSGNPVGKYSAAYAIWRQIAHEINKTYPPEDLKILASQIPQPLYDDRQAILQKYYRYKGYFPNVTDAINDTYLKIQGVQAGTEDYDGFLQLYFRLINAKDWE